MAKLNSSMLIIPPPVNKQLQKRNGILLLCAFFFLHLQLQAQTETVVIAGSQTHTIASKTITGQDYELQVMLPAGYGKGNKTYPVLYLMDSQWDFPLVTALYGQQYYDGFVPELIVVGITWTGRYSNADSLRARDYTPTNESRVPQSGGAAKFLSFIKTEVVPFVESQYRADKSDRTLMGCSLGGLFTLYSLFTEPGLFQRYVAASPAVAWGNGAISQYEKQYFDSKTTAPAKLYLCVGGVERGVPLFEKFVRQLNSRPYKQMQVKKEVLENIGHSGTKGEGYEHGLQYIFARPVTKLTAQQLQSLSGKYTGENGSKASIAVKDGNLVLSFAPTNNYTLHAASQNELYATAEYLNLHVKRDGNGTVTGIEVERYGGRQRYSKQR